MTLLAISGILWFSIYLLVGWMIAKDMNLGMRIVFTLFWGVLPFIVDAIQGEEPPFNGVEGFCTCKRRHWQDAGGKYCSICGGKIKDKLWKRS